MPVTVRLVHDLLALKRGPVREVEAGWLLSELVPAELTDLPQESIRCILNGAVIPPESRQYTRTVNGDEVIFAPEVRAAAVPFIVTTLASTFISYAVGKVFGPSQKGHAEGSPTYAFDRIENTTKNGTPIPVVYGTHKTAGQYIKTIADSVAGQAGRLHLLIGLSEGEVQQIAGLTADADDVPGNDASISGIKINDTPIAQLGDTVLVSVRLGTDDQRVLPVFEEDPTDVATNILLDEAGLVANYTTSQAIDAYEFRLDFPDGLYESFSLGGLGGTGGLSNPGQIEPRDIVFRRRQRVSPAGGWSSWVNFTVGAMVQWGGYSHTERVDGLTPEVYDIQVERVSPLHETKIVPNPPWISSTYAGVNIEARLMAVKEINYADQAYPYLATIAIKAVPSEKLYGSTPTVTTIINGRKVRIWNGSTWSVAWSDNPAWCLFDILTSKRYGLGNKIAEAGIDLESFLDFADYCDELVDDGAGGTHARHRLDMVLDGSQSAWDAANAICATARASLVKTGNTIKVKIDRAESPVQLFTRGNVVAGSFSLKYLPTKDRANFIEANYLNAANDYEQDVEQAEDISAQSAVDPSLNKETIDLFGVTRRAQAQRECLYHLNLNRYQQRWLSFGVGVDALAVEAGDVIRFQGDVPQWGFGGRCGGGGASAVTLDQSVTLEVATTYQVMVRHGNDTVEIRTVADAPGTYRTLTVTAPWATTPVAGEVFAFGETDILVKPFRITKVTRTDDLHATLECVEYNVNVYSDVLELLPSVTYTALPNPKKIPADVTDLVLSERTTLFQDGSHGEFVDVSFALPVTAEVQRAKVWWRKAGGTTWAFGGVAEDRAGYVTIGGSFQVGDQIQVAVASVSLFGAYKEPDDAVQDSVVLVGVQDQPQDPTGFALAQKGDVLYFRWDAIEAADVAGFEMRVGASWAAGVPIVQKFSGTEWSTVNFAPGEQQYMLKAINTAGNYSNNPAVIVADIDPRINQNILVSREEHQEGWDGTKSHFTADADGNLQQDTGQATAVYTTPVVDAGDVVRTRFSVRIVQEQSDLSLTWAGATFTWDSEEAQNRTWEGPLGETHITVTIEYRTSDDNVNWRAWQPYVVKEETFRYFQSRATVVSDDAATYVLKLLEYETILDVHDVMEHDENLVVIAAGQDIVFANTFHKEPAVTPAIHGALIGDRFVLTKNGVVGFHLRCYDNNDVAVERTVDWIARGF